MVLRYCFRCGYSSKKKSSWQNHLKRSNICLPSYLDITYLEILNNYDEYFDDFITLFEERLLFHCSECNFTTKHERSLKRHIKNKVCDKNKSDSDEVQALKDLLEMAINRLAEASNNNYGVVANNGGTNTINSNNTTQNTTHNTNVVNFGSESTNHISFEQMLEIGHCVREAIPKLVEAVHFGDDPRFRNIAISNLRANYGQIKRDGEWRTLELAELLEELLTNNCDRFTDFIDQNRDCLPSRWVERIDKLIDDVNNLSKVKSIEKQKIKNIVYDNSKGTVS